MSIWEYMDPISEIDRIRSVVGMVNCPFCLSELDRLSDDVRETEQKLKDISSVAVCAICGWWWAQQKITGLYMAVIDMTYGTAGCLRAFDMADVSAPIDEVRSYLAARYESRFDVHPRLFEEVVASVFRDLGYRARVTAYSADDGIDVVLDGPNDVLIGIQVKRYRNSIKVEAIRSLLGALIIRGYTEGVFVTTSVFQQGCQRTTELSSLQGIPIRLMNGQNFFDALKIGQRERYINKNDKTAPFANADFALIDDQSFKTFF